jgi:hypothetical protein
MLITETRPVPAREEVVTTATLCDLCQAEIANRRCQVHDATVSLEEGVRYPDGGHLTETTFDICAECFRGKLVPWLAGLGAHPREREVEW